MLGSDRIFVYFRRRAVFPAATKENNIMDERKWQAIEPTRVKNVVELFNDDWMALAAGDKDGMNAMTVSWGQMGELWGKPVVTIYVRDSRYTKLFVDSHDYFTLNAFPKECHKALAYIGAHSGRDGDKLSVAGLHPVFTELGNPTFEEATLCIECRKMYEHRMASDELPADSLRWYADGDLHTMYVAEIVNVLERA